jgi:osmotically-inducible protein OsmY
VVDVQTDLRTAAEKAKTIAAVTSLETQALRLRATASKLKLATTQRETRTNLRSALLTSDHVTAAANAVM